MTNRVNSQQHASCYHEKCFGKKARCLMSNIKRKMRLTNGLWSDVTISGKCVLADVWEGVGKMEKPYQFEVKPEGFY